MDYEIVKLKEIANFNKESIGKNSNYEFINYLDTANITNGAIDTIVRMPIEEAPSRAKRIVHNNDIVYSTVRPNLCHFGILDSPVENMIVSTGFTVISCKDDVNPYYVYNYLTQSDITSQLHSIAENSTSAYPSIKPSDLESIEIKLPKLDIQNKIAKILTDIDKKIKINNEINNNLQELINNIFISKFVNFDEYTGEYKTTEIGDIPINWRTDNFGSVISFSNGYGWDSKDMLENSEPDTYKVFKMGNIKIGGGINKEKTKSWILKEKCSGLEQFLSKKGDVLMCMTDMKSSENPLLGHTALIDRDDEFVINQRVGLIRCDKDIKWPYIYTMTNLPFFISDIRSKAHSGVQVNLTTSGICDTKVLIPDEESLNEFYKNVTPMYEKMFVLNNEIEYLEQLRDTLLPKLMNGEIDLDNIEI